jgi:amino acid transporter
MAKSGHIIGYIKFLPIVLCIVGAIAITIKGNPDNLFSKDSSSAGKFTTLGMLDSLPAVLFSFNGFLIAGDMGHKMKDPDKNVGKAIVFSMLVIAGIYLTVAVTLAIVGATGGNALKVLDGVLGSDTGQKIMTALLLIVILGSTCLLTMVSYQTVKKHVKNEDMPLYAQITKINNKRANLGDVVATAIVIMI